MPKDPVKSHFKMRTFVAIIVFCVAAISATTALSGTGSTTRYWDCCKPSCSWKENMPGGLAPVASCDVSGDKHIDPSVHSGCDKGGSSYVCNNMQPWAVNDSLAYGFVAASFPGVTDNSKCGICLKLTFLNALAGKTLIVQNINKGRVLYFNRFNIQMPGAGVGNFTLGCQTQSNAPPSGWGDPFGGVRSDQDCKKLPPQLQAGCHFRFGWYKNAKYPKVKFEQIKCPEELTRITGTANNNFS